MGFFFSCGFDYLETKRIVLYTILGIICYSSAKKLTLKLIEILNHFHNRIFVCHNLQIMVMRVLNSGNWKTEMH